MANPTGVDQYTKGSGKRQIDKAAIRAQQQARFKALGLDSQGFKKQSSKAAKHKAVSAILAMPGRSKFKAN